MKEENIGHGLSLNTIYNMDCIEGMKLIPDGSIDAVITDPPYLFVKGGMSSKKFNIGKNSKESYMVKSMSDFGKEKIDTFLDNIKPKMKKMNSFIFCSKLQIPHYLNWAIKNKYNFDIGIFDKMSGAIKSKLFLKPCDYFVRIYSVGLKKNDDISLYNKIKSYKMPKEKYHETQKPIQIIKDFVLLSSNEGDVVLDPFMGSGTTAIACINTNRNFIGFELDEQYRTIANNRIAEHTKQSE